MHCAPSLVMSILTVGLQAVTPDLQPFAIEVVDAQTGRGIPLVELRTVHEVLYVTDSNGLVALREPSFMGRQVFFHLKSHGYEYPQDGFGYAGVQLTPEPGGSAMIKLKRTNIAQRLYRITGAGIYRDSVMLGKPSPLNRPVLNAQVLGSDSTINAVYRDRIYWFWGDTNRLSYPLGNFHVPGATSRLPEDEGLDPSVGIDLQYYEGGDGFARPTAQLPGPGPTWLSSLVVLTDRNGDERLYAFYVKVRKFLEVYQWGLVRFEDESKRFVKVAVFPLDSPIRPDGAHCVRNVEKDGVEYVYFAHPVSFRASPGRAGGFGRPEAI